MKRGPKGEFLPGHSGNPGGRPRTPERVKEMLDGLTEAAVTALADAVVGDDPKLRLTAAQEILNRSLGKPHTTASIDLRTDDAATAHLTALTAMSLAAAKALAQALPSSPIQTIEADAVEAATPPPSRL